MAGQVVVDCVEIEIPAVARIALHQRVLEQCPPFGTEDVLLEILGDGIEAPLDVDSLQVVEIPPNLSNALMVVLIGGCGIDPEVSGHLIEVVACGCQCHLPSQAVPTHGGHRDASFVHEPCHIVCMESLLLATYYHPKESV